MNIIEPLTAVFACGVLASLQAEGFFRVAKTSITPVSAQTEQMDLMRDAWSEMQKFSPGLPATAPLPDGDTLMLFYAGKEVDATDVYRLRLHA